MFSAPRHHLFSRHYSWWKELHLQGSRPSLSVDSAIAAYSEHTRFGLADLRRKQSFILDMDGVLYHGDSLLPGAASFISWLRLENKSFVFLTNSSQRSPLALADRLRLLGIPAEPAQFYTSALATAALLSRAAYRRGSPVSAFVIGDSGLREALTEANVALTDADPDFVVVGETRDYDWAKIEHAATLVRRGARLIGTNPDVRDRKAGAGEGAEFEPACGALIKPIEMASGAKSFFAGKPSPAMVRAAMDRVGAKVEDTVVVGDRMDTDILAAVQAGIDSVLVLTGVTTLEDVPLFAYRPDCILRGVADIVHGGE